MRSSFKVFAVCFIGLLSSTILANQNYGLLKEREGFSTQILSETSDDYSFDEPPVELMSIVQYKTPLGDMSAYLTKPNEPNKKYPAIIWITGGFPSGGAGRSVWTQSPKDNDQSAKNYWQNNVVSMYPSLRGSFGNPGVQEGFFGEVNDVLSALEYLSTVEYVDSTQIYLGGHSTGATLALLVAASTDKFKAVFALGPISDPAEYGASRQLYQQNDRREAYFRAPINFLKYIQSPTFIIEGVGGDIDSLNELKASSKNDRLTFMPVDGANHFAVIYPVNRLVAKKIAAGSQMALTQTEVQLAVDDVTVEELQVKDLQTLLNLRSDGVKLDSKITARYLLLSKKRQDLKTSIEALKRIGFLPGVIETHKNAENGKYYSIFASKEILPNNLISVFKNSHEIQAFSLENGLYYQGWSAGPR